ncbi:MAG: hypothetical protein ACK42Y_01285 [Candidatus Thermochlorobacter sp.]
MSSCSVQALGQAAESQFERKCPTCGFKVVNPFITKCPRCATKLSLAELCRGCFQSSTCHGESHKIDKKTTVVQLTLPATDKDL